MSFLPNYIYPLALCFLLSLLLISKPLKTEGYLKFFTPYLLVALIIETYTNYLSSRGKSNVVILNFYSVLEFCFYLFILSRIINNLKTRKIITIVIPIYALVAIANIVFFQGISNIPTTTYSLGCLLIVAFCVYYFFEILTSPKSGKLLTSSAFWICVGLLLFYCCTFPMIGLINSWRNMPRFLIKNFGYIIDGLHVFLYTTFTIAFLCRIKAQKYISSPS